MKFARVAFKYLLRYRMHSGLALFCIILSSLFEGVSFGMLVPLLRSMTNPKVNPLEKIPFIDRTGFDYASMTHIEIISCIFIILFILVLMKNAVIYAANILISKFRFGLIRDLNIELINSLIYYDLSYFDNAKTGHIINSFNNETERMGEFMMAVFQFIILFAKVATYIILLFFISWKMSLAVFALIAIVLLPLELLMKKVELFGSHFSKAMADQNYKLTEILNGIRVIKSSSTEESEKGSFKEKACRVFDLIYRNSKYVNLIIPLAETIILGLIVVVFLVYLNITKIDVSAIFPSFAAYLFILARALTQLNALNTRRCEAISRLAAFGNYEEMIDSRNKKRIISGNKNSLRLSDSIQFRNVTFAYSDSKEVLKDISMRIPKGKITAIVGASGAGKSTLINLILRFYDITSGAITVDGVDLKEITLESWRRQIGFVSQDILIFNTSVKHNISYGHPGTSNEEILKAAKAAYAHDFIMTLPKGYDTILGERGVKLSGGQKQRISIAKAIIHNPQILILDEATSSLDTETEKLIREAVDRITKGRTVIAIAHRLSTILHADSIVVLDHGKVVEVGRHSDLIKNNSLYKRLYDAQFNNTAMDIEMQKEPAPEDEGV